MYTGYVELHARQAPKSWAVLSPRTHRPVYTDHSRLNCLPRAPCRRFASSSRDYFDRQEWYIFELGRAHALLAHRIRAAVVPLVYTTKELRSFDDPTVVFVMVHGRVFSPCIRPGRAPPYPQTSGDAMCLLCRYLSNQGCRPVLLIVPPADARRTKCLPFDLFC